MAILLAPSAPARGATLADPLRFVPSTSTDVVGYVVHVGDTPGFTASGTGSLVDIGMGFQMVGGEGHLPLSAVIGDSAYLVMQAYDSEGLFSAPSNEIHVSIDPPVGACASDAQCDDGNACNGAERCSAGACVAGSALSCVDPGPCQSAWCDVASGCRTSDVPDGTLCDDGDPYTVADSCQAGTCAGVAPPASPAPDPGPTPPPDPTPVPPAPDGTLFFDDFEVTAIGEIPAGWVVTDTAGSFGNHELEVFPVDDGGRALGTAWPLGETFLAHLDVPGSGGWSSYEYIGRMRVDDPNGGIGVTLLSTWLEGGGHAALSRDAAQPSFRLEVVPADPSLRCATGVDTGYVPAPGAWSIFRLRAVDEVDGIRLQAKVWDERDAEPADWTIDCTSDGGAVFAGRPGMLASGPGGKYVDDVGAWTVDVSQGDSEVTLPLWGDDFDEHVRGQDPDGWVDTARSRRLDKAGRGFRVEEDPGGERALYAQAAGMNLTSHVQVSGSDQWRDYELTGRMMVPYLRTRHGVLVYSEMPLGRGAIGLVRSGLNGAFRIAMIDAPGATCDGIQSTGVTTAPGEWKRFRLRATTQGGTVRVLARVWTDGSAEPTAWQADCTSAAGATPTAGTVGAWSSSSGPKFWDDLEVRQIGAP